MNSETWTEVRGRSIGRILRYRLPARRASECVPNPHECGCLALPFWMSLLVEASPVYECGVGAALLVGMRETDFRQLVVDVSERSYRALVGLIQLMGWLA
jgi:hypothetical protein